MCRPLCRHHRVNASLEAFIVIDRLQCLDNPRDNLARLYPRQIAELRRVGIEHTGGGVNDFRYLFL